MSNKKIERAFWVSNISNRNVSLGDLALTIPAFSSVNLMDTRHYHYTLEQVTKSAVSGSIFAKRNKILIRHAAPIIIQEKKLNIPNNIPSRGRSTFEIKEEKYDELITTDDEWEEENFETADMDQQKQYFVKE
jgi:hypothetical protein